MQLDPILLLPCVKSDFGVVEGFGDNSVKSHFIAITCFSLDFGNINGFDDSTVKP